MQYRVMQMLALTAALLGGCDNKPKTEPPPPPLPQMIKNEKQVLDNAKGVSDALGKQAEEQRKQIEEAVK